jgi:basic amino acid/polyamine antiporter, APA family
MGRGADLPKSLARLGKGENPWRSVVCVGIVAMIVAAFAPFVIAIAVSSFGTLLYYTVTNLSALRLQKDQRMFPRALAVSGLVGCLGLAFALAPEEIAIGLAILSCGVIFRILRLGLQSRQKATDL